MGRVLVFLVGAFFGAAAAHVASRTPVGGRVFGVVNSLADEFASAISDSYRARLAEGR